MTEIAVTPLAATPEAPPAAAVDPAKPVEGTPATPAAPTPEEVAKAKELEGARQESRELANAKAAAWRAQQAEKAAREKYEELTKRAEADRERWKAIEERESVWKDPDKFLDEAEKHGLTAQKLLAAAAKGKDPADVIAQAKEEAKAAAKAEFERLQGERDTEQKKQRDEHNRTQAIENWQKEILSKETEYPAMSALLSAGPVLRETVRQHAFRIYALAEDDKIQNGITHTPEDINKSLEDFLAVEYASLTQRISGSKTGQPSSATSNSESSTKSAVAAPNVTSAAANGNLSLAPELPKDFKSWPAEKQNRFFLDEAAKKT